jgi:hypothetical protein
LSRKTEPRINSIHNMATTLIFNNQSFNRPFTPRFRDVFYSSIPPAPQSTSQPCKTCLPCSRDSFPPIVFDPRENEGSSGGPVVYFGNQAQSYTAQCPSPQIGAPVTVIVPEDTYYGLSQNEADQVAYNNAVQAATAGLSCQFGNEEQEFEAECGGGTSGSPNTEIIPPNTYLAATQAEANALALQAAMDAAYAGLVCTPAYTFFPNASSLLSAIVFSAYDESEDIAYFVSSTNPTPGSKSIIALSQNGSFAIRTIVTPLTVQRTGGFDPTRKRIWLNFSNGSQESILCLNALTGAIIHTIAIPAIFGATLGGGVIQYDSVNDRMLLTASGGGVGNQFVYPINPDTGAYGADIDVGSAISRPGSNFVETKHGTIMMAGAAFFEPNSEPYTFAINRSIGFDNGIIYRSSTERTYCQTGYFPGSVPTPVYSEVSVGALDGFGNPILTLEATWDLPITGSLFGNWGVDTAGGFLYYFGSNGTEPYARINKINIATQVVDDSYDPPSGIDEGEKSFVYSYASNTMWVRDQNRVLLLDDTFTILHVWG